MVGVFNKSYKPLLFILYIPSLFQNILSRHFVSICLKILIFSILGLAKQAEQCIIIFKHFPYFLQQNRNFSASCGTLSAWEGFPLFEQLAACKFIHIF